MQKNHKQKDIKEKDTQEEIVPNELIEELKSPPKEVHGDPIPTDELKKEARKRSAKEQPFYKKLVQVFKPTSEPFRELIINAEPFEWRVALLVDGLLEKFEVERRGEARMVSAIFKGKIQNHEPGLKAAFVDIGQEKNAFLHYWDILPETFDSSFELVRENQSQEERRRKEKISMKDIPSIYPIGADIVVQVTKTQIGTKGPRVTTNISIPGRYLVLTPYSGDCGISKKIEDNKERERLKEILRNLTIPQGMGVIIRTAGEGKKIRYFIRDLHLLLKQWQAIAEKIDSTTQPVLLNQEPDLVERTVRDFLTEEIDRILVDQEDVYQHILHLIEDISPRSKSKVTLFTEAIPIFERFNIERQIEQTFMKRVSLPSGGEIVIEEAEALTSVDVNTGSHKVSTRDGKDFIFQANSEAAKEAARQIILRNIGGLIIIDFIDMKNRRDRKIIFDTMRKEMSKDKSKTHILPISALGILQMTRQRHTESFASGLYAPCPYCQGRGHVKSPRSISTEIQRRITSILRHRRGKNPDLSQKITLQVFLHPTIFNRLRTEDEYILIEIEDKFGVELSFKANSSFHIENFKVIDTQTGLEVR